MLPGMIESGQAQTMGIATLIQARKTKKESERFKKEHDRLDAAIPLYDPNMLALRGETERRRRAFDAGADPLTGYNIRRVMQTGAQTQENALRAGARGVGDLMRVQSMTNEGIAGASALAARRSDSAFGMEGALTQAMAERVYNRQMADKRLAWNQYARAKEDWQRQRSAGIAMLVGAKSGLEKNSGVSPQSGAAPLQQEPYAGTNQSAQLQSMGYNSPSNYGFNYQAPPPNYSFNYQQPTYQQQGIGFNYQQPNAGVNFPSGGFSLD